MAGLTDATIVREVGELYAAHSRQLERIVRADVRASPALVEDACQFAWSRLIDHARRVRRETALAWLATTAVREALRLIDRASREAPLDRGAERPACLSPEQVLEHRERLAQLSHLPARQQRMIWLHALGLSYAEIAAAQGCTIRTVERQLLRGKRALRHGTWAQ